MIIPLSRNYVPTCRFYVTKSGSLIFYLIILIDYIENGNIKNSVNYPDAEMNAAGTKVCVMHKNIPAVISQLTTAFGSAGINIENMVSKSKKDYAYTMLA